MTHIPTSQVLDYTQKSFIIELEIQIVLHQISLHQQPSITELKTQLVQHQSTVSCLQVTVVISGQRDTYIHTLHELLLTAECSTVGHVQ